jgi:hypothetical protein
VQFSEGDHSESRDLEFFPLVHSPPKIIFSEIGQIVRDDFDRPNYSLRGSPFAPVSGYIQSAPMTDQTSTPSLESSFETEESDLSLFASFFKMEAFDMVEESFMTCTQDGREETTKLPDHIQADLSPDADQNSSSGLVERREDQVTSPSGLSLAIPSNVLESPIQENVDSIPSGKSCWPSYHNSVRHLIS